MCWKALSSWFEGQWLVWERCIFSAAVFRNPLPWLNSSWAAGGEHQSLPPINLQQETVLGWVKIRTGMWSQITCVEENIYVCKCWRVCTCTIVQPTLSVEWIRKRRQEKVSRDNQQCLKKKTVVGWNRVESSQGSVLVARAFFRFPSFRLILNCRAISSKSNQTAPLLSSKTIASSFSTFHRASFSRFCTFYISAGSLLVVG